jgi:hypothetical protein
MGRRVGEKISEVSLIVLSRKWRRDSESSATKTRGWTTSEVENDEIEIEEVRLKNKESTRLVGEAR